MVYFGLKNLGLDCRASYALVWSALEVFDVMRNCYHMPYAHQIFVLLCCAVSEDLHSEID